MISVTFECRIMSENLKFKNVMGWDSMKTLCLIEVEETNKWWLIKSD